MGPSLLRPGDRVAAEPAGPPPAAAPRPGAGAAPQRPPFSLPLADPSRLMAGLAVATGPLRPLRHLIAPGALVALWVVWFHRYDLLRHAERMTETFALWQHLLFGMLTANLLGKVAQGTAMARLGGPPRAFGVGLAFGVLPRFYIDLGPADLQPAAGQVRIYGAPLLMRLALFAGGALVWDATRRSGSGLADLAVVLSGIGASSFLLTANPLWPADGYRWLAARVGRPRLRANAMRVLGLVLRGRRIPGDLPRSEFWMLLLYAAVSLVFTAILLYLVLAAIAYALERQFRGTGVVVFCLLLAAFAMYLLEMRRRRSGARRGSARPAVAASAPGRADAREGRAQRAGGNGSGTVGEGAGIVRRDREAAARAAPAGAVTSSEALDELLDERPAQDEAPAWDDGAGPATRPGPTTGPKSPDPRPDPQDDGPDALSDLFDGPAPGDLSDLFDAGVAEDAAPVARSVARPGAAVRPAEPDLIEELLGEEWSEEGDEDDDDDLLAPAAPSRRRPTVPADPALDDLFGPVDPPAPAVAPEAPPPAAEAVRAGPVSDPVAAPMLRTGAPPLAPAPQAEAPRRSRPAAPRVETPDLDRLLGVGTARPTRGRRLRTWAVWIVVLAGLVWLALRPISFEVGGEFVVQPLERAEARSRTDGEIIQIAVQEGDWVEEGDVMAVLSNWDELRDVALNEADRRRIEADLATLTSGAIPEQVAVAEQALKTAELRVEVASKALERDQALFESGTIPESSLDETRASYDLAVANRDSAQAELDVVQAPARQSQIDSLNAALARNEEEIEFSRLLLEYTNIRAPVTGQVVSSLDDVPLGAYLPTGGLFAEIEDNRVVIAEVEVPETTIAEVAVDAPAELRLWSDPETPIRGTVKSIAPRAEEREFGWVIRVQVEVPNPDGRLAANMTGFGKITAAERPAWRAFSRAIERFFVIELWSWLP